MKIISIKPAIGRKRRDKRASAPTISHTPVAALAMGTSERAPRATTYQHTHFLRPAMGDDFRVEVTVLRFGKASAYAEARVTFLKSGDLVARAALEFAF